MEKTPTNFASEVRSLLECPLCLATLIDPVQLPCLHSFCERCIKHFISEQQGNLVKCPVCRASNPAGQSLVRDFFKQNLIDISRKTLTCKKHSELIVRFCTVCKRLMCVDCVADKCQNGQYGHKLVNKDVIEKNVCDFFHKSQLQVSQWKTIIENSSTKANTMFEEAAKAIKTLINSHADDVCNVVKQEASTMCKQVDKQCAVRKKQVQLTNDEALKSVEMLEKAIASGIQSPLEDRIGISFQLEEKMKRPNIVDVDQQSCSLDVKFIPTDWKEHKLSIGTLQKNLTNKSELTQFELTQSKLTELQDSTATPNLVVRNPRGAVL